MVQDMAEGMEETLIDNPSLKESLQKSLQEIRKAVTVINFFLFIKIQSV